MDICCPDTDYAFQFKADIYYSIVTQNQYGQAQKEWVYDREIYCNVRQASSTEKEEIKPAMFLQNENLLAAASKQDIRTSSTKESYGLTNILITNIRDKSNNTLYIETAGPRSGKGTIYEVATVLPFVGPFGSIEHYSMVWRRTENQAVGD
jgi:head-tail adaptor